MVCCPFSSFFIVFFSKIGISHHRKKQIGTFTKPRDAAMAYDEAIVANHLPWKKLNFPDGMPIEDQSDDDDGYWM